MAETSIEWTSRTWNPLRGCTRVSPGCQNCYAERMAARFSGPGMPYEGLAKMTPQGPRWTGAIRLLPNVLNEPLRWRKPQTVFVNSMSDLFHKDVPVDFILDVFAVMAQASRHTFQILTKRPDRMAEVLASPTIANDVWVRTATGLSASAPIWPLPNVWLGTSVENQEYADKRIPELVKCPAAVRFLSCEPLLGPLKIKGYLMEGTDPGQCVSCGRGHGFTRCPNYGGISKSDTTRAGQILCDNFVRKYHAIHWAIAGCESGPGARPMNEDWVRSLRDQCVAADTKFFYKQRLDERGHKASLPELDGKVWDEMPELTHAVR